MSFEHGAECVTANIDTISNDGTKNKFNLIKPIEHLPALTSLSQINLLVACTFAGYSNIVTVNANIVSFDLEDVCVDAGMLARCARSFARWSVWLSFGQLKFMCLVHKLNTF
jgi:hypothetical protein